MEIFRHGLEYSREDDYAMLEVELAGVENY